MCVCVYRGITRTRVFAFFSRKYSTILYFTTQSVFVVKYIFERVEHGRGALNRSRYSP